MKAIKILVVEETTPVRNMIKKVLSDCYDVVVASNGEMALQQLRQELPDVLICDITLGVIDCLEMCHRVRHDPKAFHLPIMILTSQGSVDEKIAGFLAGADDYLVKPIQPEQLKSRIRLLCRIKGLEV